MGRKGTHLTCRQKNWLLVSLQSWQANQIQQTVIISPGAVIITLIVKTNTGKKPRHSLTAQIKCAFKKTQNLQRPNFLLTTWLFHWHYGYSCRGSLSHQVAASVSLQKKGVRILRVIVALGALPEGVWYWSQGSLLPWSYSLLGVIFVLFPDTTCMYALSFHCLPVTHIFRLPLLSLICRAAVL